MQYTFAQAELYLGENEARRTIKVREVILEVNRKPQMEPAPRSRSPFLDGRIQASGGLLEECRPSSSLLAKGRQAILRLSAAGKWSLLRVVLLDLGAIQAPTPNQRLYPWTFLVVDNPCDSLGLVSSGDVVGDELGIEDLLDILGARTEEIGKDANGQPITYNAEGGFRRS